MSTHEYRVLWVERVGGEVVSVLKSLITKKSLKDCRSISLPSLLRYC